MKQLNNKKAFTLIELIIVIGIIGILSVITFPGYRSAQQKLALQRSANKLAQDIRRAQEMAMSARKLPGGGAPPDGGYGTYINKFENDRYYIYADISGNQRYSQIGDQIIETIYIEKGIKIEEVELDGSPAITGDASINFRPPDPIVDLKDGSGAPYQQKATITLCIKEAKASCFDIVNTKIITINKVGLIYVE